MNVLIFGTYDVSRHPRISVVIEGLRAQGVTVEECNRPLAVDTQARVAGVAKPWRLLLPGLRLLRAWLSLWRMSRTIKRPDVVVIGYLATFDVHLARLVFRRCPLVLDQMVFAGDTARDRNVGSPWMVKILDWLDRRAVSAADVVMVDTPESAGLIPAKYRRRGLVVPVGAPLAWFGAPQPHEGPLRVVFFGLYTPLQGTTTIGEAIALVAAAGADVIWTMVGTGQDLEAAKASAGGTQQVQWLDWVDAASLPKLVADHDVCLGIFGVGDKAGRVVPNKVYQGAAAGCVVVTSDTEPQRRMLGTAGVFVPPGDAQALASTIMRLAEDREWTQEMRTAAYRHATGHFGPDGVVSSLADRLRTLGN